MAPATAARTESQNMANDNIIYPARFSGPAQSQATRRDADERFAERSGRQRARLREIETGTIPGLLAGKKGYCFNTLSDRQAAARAVDDLVGQAKEHNVSVEQIKAAHHGTKRLDRYRLRSDLAPEEARARSGKLMKQVNGYLKVAETIARLIGRDPDTLKLAVLAGTTWMSRSSSWSATEDPRADHLAVELAEMCRTIARRTQLKALLERTLRVPGRWDLLEGRFAANTIDKFASVQPCLQHSAFVDWYEHWTEAPPLPSVPLARYVHSIFYLDARIENSGRTEPLRGDAALSTDFAGRTETVAFELSREIRLALGPLNDTDSIGGMFETRAHVRMLRFEGATAGRETTVSFHELTPNMTLKTADDPLTTIPPAVFQTLIGGSWHRVATTSSFDEAEVDLFDLSPGADPARWSPDPRRTPGWIEHWYLHWRSITPSDVKWWFDKPAGTNNAVATLYEGPRSDAPIWYARGTVAHDVERGLANGGLEAALTAAVVQMKQALERREAEWFLQATAQHEARLSRWQENVDSDEQA